MASPRRSPDASAHSPLDKRRSPRLAARSEAAKSAARSLASAVRERVWAEARTADNRTYYYHLERGITAWELPQGAILRAAGRNSLAPVAASPSKALLSSPVSAAGSKQNVELASLLTVIVGWLDETKELYHAARTELEELRSEHVDAMAQAHTACAMLGERAIAAEARTAFLEAEAAARKHELTALRKANKELDQARTDAAGNELKLLRTSFDGGESARQAAAAKAECKLLRAAAEKANAAAEKAQAECEKLRAAAAATDEKMTSPTEASCGRREAEALVAEALVAEALVAARLGAEEERATAELARELARRDATLAQLTAAHAAEIGQHVKESATAGEALAQSQRDEARLTNDVAQLRQAVAAAEAARGESAAELKALARRHEKCEDELQELKGNVRVYCRIRPPAAQEAEQPAAACAAPCTADKLCRQVLVNAAPPGQTAATMRSYEFDGVYGPEKSTAALYAELRPLAAKVAAGYSGAILAYGQTGSGKTYTMGALHELVVGELLQQARRGD